jgi:hypothetical protein
MVLVDKNQRTPQDLTQVGLGEDWEVNYWCTRYAVNGEELRACVAQVGPRAVDVEEYLRRTGGGKKIFSNTGED